MGTTRLRGRPTDSPFKRFLQNKEENLKNIHFLIANHDFTVKDVADFLGIDESTLTRWRQKDVDLKETIKNARIESKKYWFNLLRKAGERGNVAAIIFYLTNKYPDEFQDRRSLYNNTISFNTLAQIDVKKLKEKDDNELISLFTRSLNGV